MQAARRVDEHHVGAARARGGDTVEDHRRRVAALRLFDDLAVHTFGPFRELLHSRGAERVAGDHERRLPHLLEPPGDLADGRRLPRAVHADHQDHRGPRRHVDPLRLGIVRLEHAGDHVGQLVHERLARLDLLRRAALLELVDHLDRALHAHVGGDQQLLDLFVEPPVDAHIHGRFELVGNHGARLAEVSAQAPEEAPALTLFFLEDRPRDVVHGHTLEDLMPLHVRLL